MFNSRSLLSLVLPKMGDFFCVMFEVTRNLEKLNSNIYNS